MSCTKTGGPILTIYTLYDVFLCKELPFVIHNDCTYTEIFSGVNFLKLQLILNPLMRSLMHYFVVPLSAILTLYIIQNKQIITMIFFCGMTCEYC